MNKIIRAIEILKHDIYLDKRGMTYSHDALGIEAHEMAIKALEHELAIDKIIAEIQMKIKEENYGVISDHTHEDGLEEALEIIDKHFKEV